jgi:peptide/nickel transport system substrate-binding protein
MRHQSSRSATVRPALHVFVLLVALTACRERESAPVAGATSSPTPGAQLPQDGGTVVRRLGADINTLNLLHIGTDAEKQVLSYLHDALIEVDQRLRFTPGLAERWEISPDGLSYTFYLDKRATFSDGTPVRAADVIFTLNRIVDPKTESQQFAAMFEGLDPARTTAIDEKTVRVTFSTLHAGRLGNFNIPILPEHYYGKGDLNRDFTDKILGSGPYVLESREAGKQIVLQRRADYWREKPHVQRVIFKVLPDEIAWTALKTGEVDETRVTSDQWTLERNRPDVQKAVDFRQFYPLGYNFIGWNGRKPVLSDPRVRRALSMSLDRRSIINNVYYGTARVITGPFTPDQWAYNPEVPAIEYQPQQAKQLLAQAGWRDTNGDGVLDRNGQRLEIEMLVMNKPSQLQGQILQQALKGIGVVLKLTNLDPATIFSRVYDGDYEGAFLSWGLDLDPDPYAYFHSSQFPPNGQNIAYYSNPRVDQLIEQGRREVDQDRREQIYQQLHAMLAQDQPYTWTVQPTAKWAVSRRLRNVKEANGLGLFLWHPGPYDWWVPEQERIHDRAPVQQRVAQ